ncbi:MFS transporter [Paenibacillus planticolens]|uniref:MFS transporter n=1 Tax=Paenibacillus planticolens TaxID=2654976 RepID=A0ABX1ZXK4_9BACL|nr:MFS transporter [Paenibacillus planticolens]NOV03697.1 MFS transporter [Paenibacillus planticolens]
MEAKIRPYADTSMIMYGIVMFIVEFVRGAYLVSYLPTYAVNVLGFSVATVGTAVSIHYVTDTIIKCYAGYLLDHFPLRLIVQLGLLISFGGLLLMQYSQQFWLLIAASALFGVGISPIWLVCLSKVKPENRAAHMGVLYTCWLCGIGAGPVVINFVIDKSYLLSFRIMLVLWGLGWVLSLFISNVKESEPISIPLKRQISMLWDRLRSMKQLLPGMIIQTAAAGMLVPILPNFASKYLGLQFSQYSYVLIAGGVFTVIFLIPMGKLSDRWGRRWFLILGFFAFAITLYGLTFASVLWQAVLLAAILGFSYAAVLPAWNALLAQHVPENQQGMGWGLFSSIEGIGVIVGPILGGWIADMFNERAAVWVSAGLLGSIALYYLIVSPKGEKELA